MCLFILLVSGDLTPPQGRVIPGMNSIEHQAKGLSEGCMGVGVGVGGNMEFRGHGPFKVYALKNLECREIQGAPFPCPATSANNDPDFGEGPF